MRLTDEESLARLTAHDHGVLSTVHPERGVDAIPVVFAVHDGYVGIPVDRVKPKSTARLQRRTNLEADPRASLLVEHWDRGDWSQLWWVKAELRHRPDETRAASLAARLVERYEQYAGAPFDHVLVLEIVGTTGWSAALTP